MQLLVHGRNVEVTDWVREYVDKKVGKLERFLPNVNDARVELTHNATRAAEDRYTAQITVWENGYEAFVEHEYPVSGEPVRFITHISTIATGEPRREGPVTFLSRGPSGEESRHVEWTKQTHFE